MTTNNNKQLLHSAVAIIITLLLISPSTHGFSYSKRKQRGASCFTSPSSLHYTNHHQANNNNNNDDGITITTASITPPLTQASPEWVPMEIIELAAEDLSIPPSQFLQNYSDIEAYTSCDDEEDGLHECDFFGQYLGPTKWVHLTREARECGGVNRLHFEVWKDVWRNPHGSVEVADWVSKETLRYYNEFMLEEPRSTTASTITRPLVRVKVVPASFGLEGFEDALWEATEDLLTQSSDKEEEEATVTTSKSRAVTFIVAAPDLTDPILMEEGAKSSPQVEFEPDRFQSFASSLSEKLREFSRIEGVPLMDKVELTPFHPLWKNGSEVNGNEGVAVVEIDGIRQNGRYFPYPAIAVSTNVVV